MKVRDLIARLEKLEPNLDVYAYTEDERFASADSPFSLMWVHHVEVTNVILGRDEQRRPMATFDHDGCAIVTIDVTADF